MEENKVVREIPEFLKEVNLTKPDENAKHHEKLLEMAKGFDSEEATIICRIFARKYPTLMLNALSSEIVDLGVLREDISRAYTIYSAKEDAI
ncbi:MAG: hypothetical protein J6U54_17345 [Clostridiales bacterium]|nr:hypothetical protein [Clostridiales bacterium]